MVRTKFSDGRIKASDIKQGELGDCFFLAAASAIALTSDRMETVFEQDLFKAGGYAVNLFVLGVP